MRYYEVFPKLLALSLALLFAWGLAAQQPLSVKESVQFALQNSPQILKSKLETRQSEEKVKEYKSTGLPQIDFSANLTYNL
jgi:outer membrane protein TolC